MSNVKSIRVVVWGGIALGMTSLAVAQVPYLFFDSSSVEYHPGDQFEIKLFVEVPSASVEFNGELIAANYWLGTDLSGSGKFSVLGRTFENGFSAATGSPSFPEVLSNQNPANSLQYITPNDLGATIGAGSPVSQGTHLLSKLTIKIDSSTTPGSYPLFTTTTDGFGWVDSSTPFGNEEPFSPQAGLTVKVSAIPEPGQFAVVGGLGLLGFAAYRRFSRRQN